MLSNRRLHLLCYVTLCIYFLKLSKRNTKPNIHNFKLKSESSRPLHLPSIRDRVCSASSLEQTPPPTFPVVHPAAQLPAVTYLAPSLI